MFRLNYVIRLQPVALVVLQVLVILLPLQQWSATVSGTGAQCYRTYPQPGTWLPEPPYWVPHNCSVQRFSIQETIDCMKNRTMYVIGNSVPRQFPFSLLKLMGGEQVRREGQRDLCPKHETFWGANCHQEFQGVNIRFLHMNWLDGFDYSERGGFRFGKVRVKSDLLNSEHVLPNKPSEIPGAPKFWEAGGCIDQLVRPCLRTFFAGHTSNDVLMFVAGTAYSEVTEAVDMNNWLLNSAANFGRYITAEFHGTVFRVTSSPFTGYLEHRNKLQQQQEEMLWNLWSPGSESQQDMWYTIDQQSINAGRIHLYNDHIHFVGPLSEATVYQMLNVLCPAAGTDEAVLPAENSLHNRLLVTTEAVIDHSSSSTNNNSSSENSVDSSNVGGTILKYYYADRDGYLHDLLPNALSCAQVLQQQLGAAIAVPLSKLRATAQRSPLPALCDEGLLLRYKKSRSVWLVNNGTRREFQSGDALLSRGFHFEDVRLIGSEKLLELLPIGNPVF